MPKVKMKLSAKERKAGVDLRNFMVVPIKGAANRRRAGGAAMLVRKPEPEPAKPKKAEKVDRSKKKLIEWAIANHPKEMCEVSTADEELRVASKLWAAAHAKEIAPTLLVTTNDLEEVEDEIEEWDTTASLDVTKTFSHDKLAEAKKCADGGAKGSNVDFVVYEVREIYRAKRGF